MIGQIAWTHLAPIAFVVFPIFAVAQETKMVTGTATYRERIALPPNAVFEATLEDVSRMDAAAVVIGSTRLKKPGQPPFRFSIEYDPKRVVENGSYVARARIAVNGKLMFVTDQSYPVLTKGHGNLAPMMIMRRAPASPGVVKRGMFQYMADAAGFTECGNRERWPVAMEGAYKELEAAYLKTRRQPGEELLVEIEGRTATRPNMEAGRPPVATLVVDRYIGIFPEETCGSHPGNSPIQEKDWKLTHLGDNPVTLGEKQRGPNLIFKSDGRVTGYGGCNNLTGGYKLNQYEISFGAIAATRGACIQGMDIESALFKTLEQVRTWKIAGEHLELYDASGKMLARFEVGTLK